MFRLAFAVSTAPRAGGGRRGPRPPRERAGAVGSGEGQALGSWGLLRDSGRLDAIAQHGPDEVAHVAGQEAEGGLGGRADLLGGAPGARGVVNAPVDVDHL